MNNLIFKLSICTVASFFILSCKKVEEKFPPGYYQFDVDAHEIGESADESIESSFTVKLNSSSEELLEIQSFTFSNLGDTVFRDTSYLHIEDKKYMTGTLDMWLNGDEPVKFSKGEILKESRNNDLIEGQIDYQIWFDGGWEYYWKYYTGTFVFRRK